MWATNATFDLQSGTYSVSARDGNACTSPEVPLSIFIPPTIVLSASMPICYGSSNGSFSAQVTGGIGTIYFLVCTLILQFVYFYFYFYFYFFLIILSFAC
jgi:hypothetical protein